MKNITSQEAHELISKSNNDLIILDVRTPTEYQDGHLPNSINIDYFSPAFTHQIQNLDPHKTYLVYCKSGGRSENSCRLLEDLGFKNIYNLTGGFLNWQPQSHA